MAFFVHLFYHHDLTLQKPDSYYIGGSTRLDTFRDAITWAHDWFNTKNHRHAVIFQITSLHDYHAVGLVTPENHIDYQTLTRPEYETRIDALMPE